MEPNFYWQKLIKILKNFIKIYTKNFQFILKIGNKTNFYFLKIQKFCQKNFSKNRNFFLRSKKIQKSTKIFQLLRDLLKKIFYFFTQKMVFFWPFFLTFLKLNRSGFYKKWKNFLKIYLKVSQGVVHWFFQKSTIFHFFKIYAQIY